MTDIVTRAREQLLKVRASGLGVSGTEELLNEALEAVLAILEEIKTAWRESPNDDEFDGRLRPLLSEIPDDALAARDAEKWAEGADSAHNNPLAGNPYEREARS